MKGNVLLMLLFVLILVCGIFLGLFFFGKPVVFSKPVAVNTTQRAPLDERGFIAYCSAYSCMTFPTLIERESMEWQLGLYTIDGRLQLGYKSRTNGSLLSMKKAFP